MAENDLELLIPSPPPHLPRLWDYEGIYTAILGLHSKLFEAVLDFYNDCEDSTEHPNTSPSTLLMTSILALVTMDMLVTSFTMLPLA